MFDETKHPRDDAGKFTYSDGKGGEHIPTEAEQKRMEELGHSDGSIDDISALLGQEFTGVKGQDAINKLLQERKGHVKGAFHRDDIGDIDLLWGNDALGLQHILMRRAEQGINTEDFLSNLCEVIEKGVFKQRNERGNFEFWYQGKMAVIAPEYHGNKITYMLTAYKRKKI